MPRAGKFWFLLCCALICFGALAACSPEPSPVVFATSTLVPSTATYTPTPLTASSTPRPSPTVALSPSPAIAPLLSISITPDAALTSRLIADLASEMNVPADRVQLVTIQESRFSANTMSCIPTTGDAFIDPVPRTMLNGYRYLLLLGGLVYEYHTNGTEDFQRCPFTSPVSDELLILVDPFAADTFRLVQNLLAEELDISSRRVLLVSMSSIIWRESSLGCPLEDQEYHEVEVVGYRIVVTAGEQEYIYHSDSTNVYPCAPENEVLPQ